jgi:thioredoxin-related protein
MKTKKLISVLVLILIISFAYISYSIALKDFRLSDPDYSYLGGITWHRSLDKGFEIAHQENKPILVYFWATWCHVCERFENEALPDQRIKKMLTEDFVLVAIDLDQQKDIVNEYGAWVPPDFRFLDENGTQIFRQPGYADPENFLYIIETIKNKYRVE